MWLTSKSIVSRRMDKLPDELIQMILASTARSEALACRRACRLWESLCYIAHPLLLFHLRQAQSAAVRRPCALAHTPNGAVLLSTAVATMSPMLRLIQPMHARQGELVLSSELALESETRSHLYMSDSMLGGCAVSDLQARYMDGVAKHARETHVKPPALPVLFLYSTTDKLIPPSCVEECAQRYRDAGADVVAKRWGNSPHVQHLRTDPEGYRAELKALLSRL